MQWCHFLRATTFTATLAICAAAQPIVEPSTGEAGSPEPEVSEADAVPLNDASAVPAAEEEAEREAESEALPEAAPPKPAALERPPESPAGAPGAEEYEEPELPMTPPAPDSLGGHFVVAAGAAYVFPFGRLGSNMAQRRQVDPGLGIGVDMGYGVSRQVIVGAWGQLTLLPEGSACLDCTATSFALGPFVRFHLVQGLRFDPWLSFGVGYRNLAINDTSQTETFRGLDWARAQLGGDWYPSSNFGFGPFMEVVSGGYFERPEAAGALRTYWQLALGARLTLDFPGRLK